MANTAKFNRRSQVDKCGIGVSPSNPNANVIGRYFYDGEGKRVKKETATETTIFVYSGGKLIQQYSTAPPPATPTTNYVATDILQSVRAISNTLGEVTSRRDFMPFGEEIYPNTNYRKTTQFYSAQTDTTRQSSPATRRIKEPISTSV